MDSRLDLLFHSLVYTGVTSVAMFACLLMFADGYGAGLAGSVSSLVLMVVIGAFGTWLSGFYLDHYQESGMERPFLKGGLITGATAVAPVYAIVNHEFLDSSLPRFDLADLALWCAGLAVAVTLALVLQRGYGTVLIALVLVAGAVGVPAVAVVQTSVARERVVQGQLERWYGIGIDLVVLDADGWEADSVRDRVSSSTGRRVVHGHEITYTRVGGGTGWAEVTTWYSLEDLVGRGLSHAYGEGGGDPLLAWCTDPGSGHGCVEYENPDGARVVLQWSENSAGVGSGTAYVGPMRGRFVSVALTGRVPVGLDGFRELVGGLRWEGPGDRERIAREWFPDRS